MLARDFIQGRFEHRAQASVLPYYLKGDGSPVRATLMRRLSASKIFVRGDRAGVLKAARTRSGRDFRLDVRQKVIVKALVSRHTGRGRGRCAALLAHVAYLCRSGAGLCGGQPEFFNGSADRVDGSAEARRWSEDRHHFRLIISPEHGDRLSDLKSYVREVVLHVGADLGEPELCWFAACHFDTDQPHAHVLVRGRRSSGRDLVIPRAYVSYGIRARAQEVAQERLGDLTRAEAEQRVWRDTQAAHFTALDRRLITDCAADGSISGDIGGRDAWSVLTRTRLVHLERLGLAEQRDGRYTLAPDLETRLRTIQLKRDILRTLNQRRLEGSRDVRIFAEPRLKGRVVSSGAHDELGASRYVVIRDDAGVEHYAQLTASSQQPEIGHTAVLRSGQGGLLMRQAELSQSAGVGE